MKKIIWVAEVIRVLRAESQAIADAALKLEDPKSDASAQMEKAIQCLNTSLDHGGKIVVTGLGKSGKIAQKIAATFASTGSLAIYLHPTEGLHGDLGIVRPQDVVLALSQGGNSEEMIRLLPFLRALGVPIIGLGGNASSLLADQCDIWIQSDVQQEACPHNLAPTTSTTLALALGDAMAIALMQLRGFDANAFAKNHPGGSLGRKLNLKVSDLMHQGSEVPRVTSESSMDEVVILSTEKKMGAVLVMDGNSLAGIITDGDLRRSLQHREKFFQLKAKQVMTVRPVCATPEMKAHSALELMENRPSQISVLPVVDRDGNCLGLLRLHDLTQAF